MGRIKNALLTGVVVGATAAVLADKKNRDKIVSKVKVLKAKAKQEFKDLRQGAAKKVADLKQEVKNVTK